MNENILWLHALRLTDLARVGGKNSSLGEMIGNLSNLGVSVPGGYATTAEAFKAVYRPMNRAVHAIVRDLGGSFSAEHGIGQLKRDELAATAPPVGLELMRRIKKAFDPAGIMNPGKVI